jgi:hypothetical protein
MSLQTVYGKAFEYSCAFQLYEDLRKNQNVEIVRNNSFEIAKSSFERMTSEQQGLLDKASKAAVNTLKRLEPRLENDDSTEPLVIGIQEDAKGQSGDVRDVLFIRKSKDWEIGISVKHNHSAVKHSRLSDSIDFGEKWLGFNCSENYFNNIKPLFDELRLLKEKNVDWKDLDRKAERFYIPLLQAFIDEIKRIDTENPNEVPKRLLEYLLGRYDFYKVISLENRKTTQILAFSLHGTLNQSAGNVKPLIKLPISKMPNRIYDIYFKPESDNTVLLALNEGWELSFRIHSASSKVEPSLKFDITLIGQPNLYSHFETWD